MSDTEVAKIKEWNKVQLLTVALVCLAVLGAVREYINLSAPSDRELLVYHFGGNETQTVTEIVTPEEMAQPQPEPQPEAQQEVAPQNNNADALSEFLDYMHEMGDKAATITFDETVLDKISQKVQVVNPEPQPVAEENKAENTQAEQPAVVEESAVVVNPDAVSEIEKAKTDVINNVLDNVEQIVADSENEVAQQDDDDAAIAEFINQEQAAEDAARQQMTEEVGEASSEDDEAPIVLLPEIMNQQ